MSFPLGNSCNKQNILLISEKKFSKLIRGNRSRDKQQKQIPKIAKKDKTFIIEERAAKFMNLNDPCLKYDEI